MESTYARPYYESFVLALIITLLPSKMLAYVAPFLTLSWFIVRSYSGKTLYRTLLFLLLYGVLIGTYAVLYYFNNVQFLVGNALVAFCTYGSVVLVLILPGKGIADRNYTYTRYAKVLKYVILLEGIIGILQFMIVSLTGRFNILSGDAVQGTIGLTAFIAETAGFGNQIFAINMAFFLTLFVPHVLVYRKDYYVVLTGLLSLMLAGVLHVFIGLLVAIVFTLLFYRRNIIFSDIDKVILIAGIVILLLVPIEIIFPGISRSANVFFKLYQGGNSPKIKAINTAVYELPHQYPLATLIGIGPGQYSSRAGLISSGEYFTVKVSFLPNRVSEPFKKFVERTWKRYRTNEGFGNSTMHRPFFSLLSLFAEFGIVGLGVFVGVIGYLFYLIRKLFFYYKTRDTISYHLCFCLAVFTITLLGISFFENYLETTQAILPGLMLFKVFYSQLYNGAKPENVREVKELALA